VILSVDRPIQRPLPHPHGHTAIGHTNSIWRGLAQPHRHRRSAQQTLILNDDSACVFHSSRRRSLNAHSLLPRLRAAARRTASGLPRLCAVAPPSCPRRSGICTVAHPSPSPSFSASRAASLSRVVAPPPCPAWSRRLPVPPPAR
jgi:hypothetical protein